jgi:hypothetical protein
MFWLPGKRHGYLRQITQGYVSIRPCLSSLITECITKNSGALSMSIFLEEMDTSEIIMIRENAMPSNTGRGDTAPDPHQRREAKRAGQRSPLPWRNHQKAVLSPGDAFAQFLPPRARSRK